MHPIACSLAYPLAYLVRRKLAHPMIYLVIVFLCTGPVVAQIGAPADDINVIGILVQSATGCNFSPTASNLNAICIPNYAKVFFLILNFDPGPKIVKKMVSLRYGL